MKFGTYRNIAMKSLNVRASKAGIRLLARHTQHVVQCRAIIGLKLGVGNLLVQVRPYLRGEQLTSEIRDKALVALSDVGYNMVILARSLKVKMPTQTKKVKLVGTLTLGLLHLDEVTNNLLDYVDGIFVGPAMKDVEKEVVLPNQGGKKEMRIVAVVDREQEDLDEQERQSQLNGMVSDLVDIFWKLTYSLTGKTPDAAFELNQKALAEANPELFEHLDDAGDGEDEEEGEEGTGESAQATA